MTTSERSKAKNRVNKKLAIMGKVYHDGLPIQQVIDILHESGFTDTDELNGVWCGRDGSTHAHVGDSVYIQISWHKMEISGRYEFIAYVS